MKPRSAMLLVWLPFVLLLASAVYVVVYWIQHRIAGPQVLGPVVLIGVGLAACALLEAVTALGRVTLEGQRDRGLAPQAAEELSRATHEIVRMVELALSFSFSWGCVLGVGTKSGVHWTFPFVTVGSVVLALFVGAGRMTGAADALRAQGLGQGLEGWNGFIYRNKSDPRMWVPKLGGVGYTLNFAHGKSWGMLALLLFPVAVLIVLGLYLR